MGIINAGIKKGIKAMAVVAQTAQFVSLMPKPKDFVTRIVGDVVYLSSRVIKLSDDLNRLLDSYTDIPTNYLMTELNSITGSLTGITDRVNIYAQNAVNQVVGIGENATNMITELTGAAIDTTGELTSAIVSLGHAVAESGSNVLGQTDMAEDIHDAAEVVLEWTDEGFKSVNARATDPVRKVTQKLTDTRTGVNNYIESKKEAVNDKVEEARKWVETLISELRDKIRKLSDTIDTGFKDVTGLTSVSNGATLISQELNRYDNSPATQATTAMAGAVAAVIKNFSIGKMVTAFAGVLTQSTIVKLGLDQLPPIDFESMMCKIRDDLTISSSDLYKKYMKETDNAYNSLIEFGEETAKIPPEERKYSAKNYEEFAGEFDEVLKKKRDEIRLMMKNTSDVVDRNDVNKVALETQKKTELRSAIKEIEKYRKKIRNARQANTMKSILGDELINFKKEVEYKCNTLKADWKSMMDQYKKAIAELKSFFTNGGSCDMFINDCCDRINQDFDEIKSLCKNLGSQLVGSAVKVVMPADIGTVVPNPVYKIVDFIMDIKTIIKFIKDLITLVLDIINHINKLARIMLNGINDLKEIVKQLMEIFGLRWLMNLIQNIIDLFGENIKDARAALVNTISPVHFYDTEEYEHTLEALDELLDGNAVPDELNGWQKNVTTLLNNTVKNEKGVDSLIKKINNATKKDEDDIDKLIDELDEKGELVVAYKSPIIQEIVDENNPNVSDMMEGQDMDSDIRFIGWIFYHPNLDHGDFYKGKLLGKLRRKIKAKIIKKASKNGHKKRGGKNMLHRKKVEKQTAYDAFYWYTYYTEDLEKDCFEREAAEDAIYVDNIVHTENGSVVEITDGGNTFKVFVADNMVRTGDYINVGGKRYRVGPQTKRS